MKLDNTTHRIILDSWWKQYFPIHSPLTKTIRFLAEKGPSTAYDIAKGIYGSSFSGYGTTVRNLKSLEQEGIVEKIGTQKGRNLRKKTIYALTAVHGIPAVWAFLGANFNFNRLLESHSKVFKNTDGLRTYIAIWEEAGPSRSAEIARKSFRSFILGTEQGQSLAELVIAGIADKSIPFYVLRNIGARSKLMLGILEEVHSQSGQLLAAIKEKQQKGLRDRC